MPWSCLSPCSRLHLWAERITVGFFVLVQRSLCILIMGACSNKSDRSPLLHTSGLAAVFHSAKECEWPPSLIKVSIIWGVGKVNLQEKQAGFLLSFSWFWLEQTSRGVSCLFELQMKQWHLFCLRTSSSQGKCLYSASGKEKILSFHFACKEVPLWKRNCSLGLFSSLCA